MPDFTTNLNLAKPTISENMDIAVLNTNMDLVDAALGAPSSEVTDLLAVYNSFNDPWVQSTPAISGITINANASNVNTLQISRHGKTVTGKYLLSLPSGFSAMTAGGLTVELPDDLWAIQGGIKHALGSAVVANNTINSVGTTLATATSGANAKLSFSFDYTYNTSTGPWSILFGSNAFTFWSLNTFLTLQANFMYETS